MQNISIQSSVKRMLALACLCGSAQSWADLPTTYKVHLLNSEDMKLMASMSGQALNNLGHVAGHAQPRAVFKPHELPNCEHPQNAKRHLCALESVDLVLQIFGSVHGVSSLQADGCWIELAPKG